MEEKVEHWMPCGTFCPIANPGVKARPCADCWCSQMFSIGGTEEPIMQMLRDTLEAMEATNAIFVRLRERLIEVVAPART